MFDPKLSSNLKQFYHLF